MVILVSACLMGLSTRYDGGQSEKEFILRLAGEHILVPVCPEQLGGLPTPRPACEILRGRALTAGGEDRTAAFERGAELAMKIHKISKSRLAILKARSPSCGKGRVYDGSFSGKLTEGSGFLARALQSSGCTVFTEEETDLIEQFLNHN